MTSCMRVAFCSRDDMLPSGVVTVLTDAIARAQQYLRREQLPDGGWSLFAGGPMDLSATIKAYFAMKLAGVGVDDPALVAARERIREIGGPVKANVFTKIQLA